MEENVIIVAGHKLLVKKSINFFLLHMIERERENCRHQSGFIRFLRSEREMFSAMCYQLNPSARRFSAVKLAYVIDIF